MCMLYTVNSNSGWCCHCYICVEYFVCVAKAIRFVTMVNFMPFHHRNIYGATANIQDGDHA